MHRIILLLYFIVDQVFAASTFNFQYYDVNKNQLYMYLVTPTTQGDVLLQVGDEIIHLKDARLEKLFSLSVQVPCERLEAGATIFWAAKGTSLHSKIPPQACYSHVEPEVAPITIFNKNGECWINVGNNTLWRAATEMSKFNKATVYQNIYAIFLANRTSFSGEDINNLREPVLRCPPEKLIEFIPPDDAHRLFKDMLEFKKNS